jgi:hypothetical protein
MSTLIRIGTLVMTPKQLERALAEDMTVSQAQEMIENDKRSPMVGGIDDDTTMTTGDGEHSEGNPGTHP